ncbi:unnamed protein product [Moneuplotes crassus]|uniref:Uncharacterized protein n=1 Tax=Euplotes crassus TaxID=5936 RepID=A0AAD1XC77_EUPCR|nr:unnamed protein product [Moneuplotes crassus]
MAIIFFIRVINVGVFILIRWTENLKNQKCNIIIYKLFKFFTFNICIRLFIQ